MATGRLLSGETQTCVRRARKASSPPCRRAATSQLKEVSPTALQVTSSSMTSSQVRGEANSTLMAFAGGKMPISKIVRAAGAPNIQD